MFSLLSIFSSISDIVCLLSFPLPNTFFFHPMLFVLPLKYASVSHLVGVVAWNIHFKLTLWIVQPFPSFFLVLWLLLTSCRSLLLRVFFSSARPHGINQYSFLVYLLGLRNRVTVTFWTSLLLVNLSAYYAFVPSFCSSGYDFAIPSSRLHLTV